MDSLTEQQAQLLVAALEALLFVASQPLPGDRIAAILGCSTEQVAELAQRLEQKLVGHGVQLTRLANGYTLATRPQYADYVQALLEPEPQRLSTQALETLAIIAYRQPITRPEIDELRGVNSAGIINSLLEKNLIRIAGRKDAPGRPFLLETTEHFLAVFGLGSLDDLPLLEQFQQTAATMALPVADTGGTTTAESIADTGEEPSAASDQ